MTASTPLTPANEPEDGTDPAALTDEELAGVIAIVERSPQGNSVMLFKPTVRRLIAALRASRAEVEALAESLWAICDGDGTAQDRIIAAGGLGDRYDHSKPNGR